jgi:hypothetical protein
MLNLRDPPQRFGIEVPTSLLFRADGVPVTTATSGFGTFRTCRAGLTMSVPGCRPEVTGGLSKRRF